MISLRIKVYYAKLSLLWLLEQIHNLFTMVNKHQTSTGCLANNSIHHPIHSDGDLPSLLLSSVKVGRMMAWVVFFLAWEAIPAKMLHYLCWFPLEVGGWQTNSLASITTEPSMGLTTLYWCEANAKVKQDCFMLSWINEYNDFCVKYNKFGGIFFFFLDKLCFWMQVAETLTQTGFRKKKKKRNVLSQWQGHWKVDLVPGT